MIDDSHDIRPAGNMRPSGYYVNHPPKEGDPPIFDPEGRQEGGMKARAELQQALEAFWDTLVAPLRPGMDRLIDGLESRLGWVNSRWFWPGVLIISVLLAVLMLWPSIVMLAG